MYTVQMVSTTHYFSKAISLKQLAVEEPWGRTYILKAEDEVRSLMWIHPTTRNPEGATYHMVRRNKWKHLVTYSNDNNI